MDQAVLLLLSILVSHSCTVYHYSAPVLRGLSNNDLTPDCRECRTNNLLRKYLLADTEPGKEDEKVKASLKDAELLQQFKAVEQFTYEDKTIVKNSLLWPFTSFSSLASCSNISL